MRWNLSFGRPHTSDFGVANRIMDLSHHLQKTGNKWNGTGRGYICVWCFCKWGTKYLLKFHQIIHSLCSWSHPLQSTWSFSSSTWRTPRRSWPEGSPIWPRGARTPTGSTGPRRTCLKSMGTPCCLSRESAMYLTKSNLGFWKNIKFIFF